MNIDWNMWDNGFFMTVKLFEIYFFQLQIFLTVEILEELPTKIQEIYSILTSDKEKQNYCHIVQLEGELSYWGSLQLVTRMQQDIKLLSVIGELLVT